MKKQILIVALLPTLLMSLFLAGYFIRQQLQALDLYLKHMGTSAVHQLTPVSRYGLMTNNREVLQGLTHAVIENSVINAVTIFNKKGDVLAYTGPEHGMAEDLSNYKQEWLNRPKHMHFLRAITVNEFNLIKLIPPLAPESLQAQSETIGWIAIDLSSKAILLKKIAILFTSFMIILVALFLGFLLAKLLSTKITKPIEQLDDLLGQAKSEQGAMRPIEFADNTLQRIAQGIHELGQKIFKGQQEFQQNVEQATADLRETLETIEVQNIELDLAYKEIQHRSRIKSEFMANLSHEIRTPMSSIIGFTNLMLETNLSSYQRDYLHTIQRSANNLLTIINDILDFSKIEAGKLKLDNIPLDVNECIEDVLTILAPSAHEKHLELTSFTHPQVPRKILGDPLRFKQILTNLINNAIKFTEQGSVTIKTIFVGEHNSRVTLRVQIKDTGIGLSEYEQKHLFNAFSQADASIAQKFGGTGLGLVISEKLIQQMDGNIQLESAPDKGTQITFTFTGSKLKNPPAEIIDLHELYNKQFIVFEKHTMTRDKLKLLLSTKGTNIRFVESPKQLTRMLYNKQDKATCDCLIIGTKNINQEKQQIKAFISAVRSEVDCPIVILLNNSESQVNEELMALGATATLIKPICEKKFYQQLKYLLRNQATQQATGMQQAQASAISSKADTSEQIHILVAEDNPANLKLLCSILENLNVNVTSASNGKLALEKANKKMFGLILLDLQMPIMDGLEAARAIKRTSKKNSHTPIVLITAHNNADIGSDKLKEAGIKDCIIKPVSIDQLNKLVKNWVQAKQKIDNKKFIKGGKGGPIDWEKSLDIVGGKEQLAKEILAILIKELPSFQKNILHAFENQEYDTLANTLHKLNGACSYCGVLNLRKVVDEFEATVKEGKIETFDAYMDELLYEIDLLLKIKL